MAEKMLVLDPEKCVGCHTCEMVCSLKHHSGSSRTRSMVRVITLRTQDNSVPILCQHCERPLCQYACPVRTIFRDMASDIMFRCALLKRWRLVIANRPDLARTS
jgi:Fe-S-cluster-containing hydrogenase component 2